MKSVFVTAILILCLAGTLTGVSAHASATKLEVKTFYCETQNGQTFNILPAGGVIVRVNGDYQKTNSTGITVFNAAPNSENYIAAFFPSVYGKITLKAELFVTGGITNTAQFNDDILCIGSG